MAYNPNKLFFEGQNIKGLMNGYLVSGIIYSDSNVIVSIPVLSSVDKGVLESLDHPEYVKNVRIENHRIDFLLDLFSFELSDLEEYMIDVTNILKDEGVESDLYYKENRVESSNKYGLKLCLLLLTNILMVVIFTLLLFPSQLGQALYNESFYISYYSYASILFLFVIIAIVNMFSIIKFKFFNLFSKKETKKVVSLFIVSSLLLMIFFNIFNIMLHGQRFLDLTFIESLRVFKIASYLNSTWTDFGEVMIINGFISVLGVGSSIAFYLKTMGVVNTKNI